MEISTESSEKVRKYGYCKRWLVICYSVFAVVLLAIAVISICKFYNTYTEYYDIYYEWNKELIDDCSLANISKPVKPPFPASLLGVWFVILIISTVGIIYIVKTIIRVDVDYKFREWQISDLEYKIKKNQEKAEKKG